MASFLLAGWVAFLDGRYDGDSDAFFGFDNRDFLTVEKSLTFENIKACVAHESMWMSTVLAWAAFSVKSAIMARKGASARGCWILMAVCAAGVVLMETSRLAWDVADFFGAIPAGYTFGSHWSQSLGAPASVCQLMFAASFGLLVFESPGKSSASRQSFPGTVLWVAGIVALGVAAYWQGVMDGRVNAEAVRLRDEDPLVWKSTSEVLGDWAAFYQGYLLAFGLWLLMLLVALRLAARQPRHWTGVVMFLCSALALVCTGLQIAFLFSESFADEDGLETHHPATLFLGRLVTFADRGSTLAALLFAVGFSIWPARPDSDGQQPAA